MSTLIRSWSREAVHGVCVAALLLVPAAAFAQTATGPGSANGAAAAELHRKADAIVASNDLRKWPDAASLLERAARLRAPDDVAAVTEQATAAEMFYLSGSSARAQTNLESAARLARDNGHVLQSAQLFLKAAVVAKARGHMPEAVALAHSAEQLARSPYLTQAECDCVLDRIIWLPDRRVAFK